jgi:hypothetical protein
LGLLDIAKPIAVDLNSEISAINGPFEHLADLLVTASG